MVHFSTVEYILSRFHVEGVCQSNIIMRICVYNIQTIHRCINPSNKVILGRIESVLCKRQLVMLQYFTSFVIHIESSA